MEDTNFAETVIRKRSSRFRKCLRRASVEAGEEEIHDLRVSIRRLLAGLSVVASLYRKKFAVAGPRKRLQALMTPLGKLRDAQVKMLWLTKVVPVGDEPTYEYALSVACDLEMWRKRVLVALGNVDSARFTIVPAPRDIPALPTSELCKIAASILRENRREVESLREKAAAESDAESLHRLRLAFKKYRYCAEIFAPLFPEVTGDTLERLHAFQTLLGDLHDFDTILADAEYFLTSVIHCKGDHAVMTRFRKLRHEEFLKLTPILSRPDGLAKNVFGDELAL